MNNTNNKQPNSEQSVSIGENAHVSSRVLVATQIMNAFISNGGINHYDGEQIIERCPETNKKITATEKQNSQIEHYTRIAYKIADSIIKYGC